MPATPPRTASPEPPDTPSASSPMPFASNTPRARALPRPRQATRSNTRGSIPKDDQSNANSLVDVDLDTSDVEGSTDGGASEYGDASSQVFNRSRSPSPNVSTANTLDEPKKIPIGGRARSGTVMIKDRLKKFEQPSSSLFPSPSPISAKSTSPNSVASRIGAFGGGVPKSPSTNLPSPNGATRKPLALGSRIDAFNNSKFSGVPNSTSNSSISSVSSITSNGKAPTRATRLPRGSQASNTLPEEETSPIETSEKQGPRTLKLSASTTDLGINDRAARSAPKPRTLLPTLDTSASTLNSKPAVVDREPSFHSTVSTSEPIVLHPKEPFAQDKKPIMSGSLDTVSLDVESTPTSISQQNLESSSSLTDGLEPNGTNEHGETAIGPDGVDWGFWGLVMANYEKVARERPKELSKAIQSGIPQAIRGMIWQLMSDSKTLQLESVYQNLIAQDSAHEKAIARDLNRTFPRHEFFQPKSRGSGSGSDSPDDPGNVVHDVRNRGEGQECLFNVVKAYSLYDADVGYTQGIQFIVGPLLLNMPDEAAFSVLVRLMKDYDLRSHFTPNMPGLQLRLFQFDRLVEEMLPAVFMKLVREGVKSNMYASQWFLTLYGYRYPLELVSCVFDMVFAEGVEAVFRFAIAILKKNEDAILQMGFEELVAFLKEGGVESWAPQEGETTYRVDEFVQDAVSIRITPLMLDQFASEWQSINATQNAQTQELEKLRKANQQLSQQVRSLEKSLAQINEEHVDLVKQFVQSRLAKEEAEEELVKYKMLFADLSHRQEMAGLSSPAPGQTFNQQRPSLTQTMGSLWSSSSNKTDSITSVSQLEGSQGFHGLPSSRQSNPSTNNARASFFAGVSNVGSSASTGMSSMFANVGSFINSKAASVSPQSFGTSVPQGIKRQSTLGHNSAVGPAPLLMSMNREEGSASPVSPDNASIHSSSGRSLVSKSGAIGGLSYK